MRLREDSTAASPLVVLSVFVLVAAGITALGFYLFFDRADPAIVLRPAGETAEGFVVHDVTGSFRWGALDVELLNSAGTDRADLYLDLPSGEVDRDDVISLERPLPGGTYLLRLLDDGDEVGRLVVQV
ncbi:MAG TPA: hypothetical protein VI796_02015 [Candidatus Thermoplasmatota archaeon]|nr:hypothetical protein [Candidatus Thermoplasmatota archaeon]